MRIFRSRVAQAMELERGTHVSAFPLGIGSISHLDCNALYAAIENATVRHSTMSR